MSKRFRFFSGLVTFSCILGVTGFSQKPMPVYRLMSAIAGPVNFFPPGKLQRGYVVRPDNQVEKYSPDGQQLFSYNNNTLGGLTHIDATNPFNLLLYYPGFQTVITLDRTLNLIGEFNLWDLDMVDLRAVAMARDNGLWLYDGGTQKLRNIDQEGRLLQESDNLSLLLGISPQPVKLVYRDNFVYAADPKEGILIFDNFAQYVQTLRLPDVIDFQLVDRRLLFQRDGEFYLFDLQAFSQTPLPLPEGVQGARQVRMEKDRLFVLREAGLEIYGIR